MGGDFHSPTPAQLVKLPCCFVRSAVSISDPFFSGNQSSWMSLPPVRARHRTVVELQFQPLSPDGILVYTAQRLSARAGECVNNIATVFTR